MASIITVPYEELIEGLQEGVTEQGPWAKKCYLVAWGDRQQFAMDMSGLTSTTGPTSPWVRPKPYRYPDLVLSTPLYAKGVTTEPAGDVITGSSPIAFTSALITVDFGMLSYSVDFNDDPLFLNSLSQDPDENESLQYATQELDYGAEYAAIPGASVKYKTSGGPVTSTINKRSLVIQMSLTWHRYPVMPMSKIADFADTVNDATFLGRDKGTVMFEGVKTVREMATDGTITQKVQMSLKWRKEDWNKALKPDGLGYDWVVDKNDATIYTYPYRNFRGLLL